MTEPVPETAIRRHSALTLALVRWCYRAYGAVAFLARATQRRLTPAGALIAASLVFTLSIGSDVNKSLSYQSTSLLAALLLSGALWGACFRGRFRCERSLPRYATVGQPVRYRLRVTNDTGRTQAGLEALDEAAEGRLGYDEFKAELLPEKARGARRRAGAAARTRPRRARLPGSVALDRIEAGGRTEVTLELTPARRGAVHFERVVIGRADPLGLIRGIRPIPTPGTLVVLPRRYRLPDWALPGTRQYQPGGVAMASAIGESEEFIGLREYRPGDPMSHIHWKSWARVGRPIVKEYQDEFFTRHALILDTFLTGGGIERFEEAVSVAASFAASLDTQESLLDLVFIGARAYCVTAGRGLAHSEQLLEVLAAVQPCSTHGFETLERVVLEHARCLSGCICVCVDWDEPRQRLVRQLTALGLPVLVLVIIPAGAEPRPQPQGAVADPSRFRVLEVGRIQQDLIAS